MLYNLLTGENTVLRGLIAEEFTRYILTQRFPILIVRPSTVLKYLDKASIVGRYVDFIRKNQQTMDFLGIAPYHRENEFKPEEIIYQYFSEKEGLTRFLKAKNNLPWLKGYVIEVKSRTGINTWSPFQFSFSPNQIKMLNQIQNYDFKIVLSGVTFVSDWNLSIVFCDKNQRQYLGDFITPS
ncbi:MAG: hypothetical protein JSW11_06865 [Candidatus Heimdallarchaeota archaeon]|nr:MAG: hypothetical protein JSW11_06865 [Candidatus Heimdallarchaeota archaeon]